MNQVRTFLLFAWLLVGFLIWQAWQQDYERPTTAAALPAPPMDVPLPADGVPTVPNAVPAVPSDAAAAPTPAVADAAAVDLSPIVVSSDLLRLTFDPRGATLQRAELLAYPQNTDAGAPPIELFSPTPGHWFAAQAGWLQPDAQLGWRALQAPDAVFRLATPVQDLGSDADRLEIDFVWTDPVSGATLERRWSIERGSYLLTLRDRWTAGSSALTAAPFRDLWREPPPSTGSGFTNPEAYSYVGAAWYSPADKFNKIKFTDFDPREPLKVQATEGWVAMLQHYFFAAWIPQPTDPQLFTTAQDGNRYRIRAVGAPVVLEPGASSEHATGLYVGPKLQEELAGIAPGLERTIDYGIFTILAEPLFWLLSMFHALVGNWGWSIVLLVLLIKAVFFKLSEAQYKSFAKMRRVQPRIEALKERYGDDKAKFNQAMMELYKKEKINPMGGCLPILVQIPVFISLYWVLLESVELRHAPWVGWIQNLSAPDPYFVLPVLNLVTMWLTQKLSPAPGMDPLQKKMMQAMPLVFGVLFAFFPAGLVLYWTVNGALGLLQQWVITRRHGDAAKPAA